MRSTTITVHYSCSNCQTVIGKMLIKCMQVKFSSSGLLQLGPFVSDIAALLTVPGVVIVKTW